VKKDIKTENIFTTNLAISKTLIEATELLLLIENTYNNLRFYVVSSQRLEYKAYPTKQKLHHIS